VALCDKEWIMASIVRSETEEFPIPAVQRIYGDVSFYLTELLCWLHYASTYGWLFFFSINHHQYQIFLITMMRLIACFLLLFCLLLFCFLSPCDFTIFWWRACLHQGVLTNVTWLRSHFFCLSLSLFITVNLKMYNISLSPHFWEFFESYWSLFMSSRKHRKFNIILLEK
jgi:hypothetical protein